jgi:hypothetical protein
MFIQVENEIAKNDGILKFIYKYLKNCYFIKLFKPSIQIKMIIFEF